MTEEERTEIQQKLNSALQAVEQDIDSLSDAENPVSPDVSLGRLSRMDAIQSKSVREAALHEAKDRKSRLVARLEALGTEQFGLCAKCGHPIPMGRILYIPETETCVNCAE